METRIVPLAAGDEADLRDWRVQLQQAIEGELHRLVGELVLEVAAQRGFQAKAGRAVLLGSSLLESLPPASVLAQLAEPEQFVTRSRAAFGALISFLAGEMNRGLEADGRARLPQPVARQRVEEYVALLGPPAWLT